MLSCMVFFGCGSSSVSYFEEESSSNKVIDSEENNLEDETQMQEKAEMTDTIFVFVCGCVQSPGVYELQMNARIFDAVSSVLQSNTTMQLFDGTSEAELIQTVRRAAP